MQVTYDAEGDVLYTRLDSVPARDTLDIEAGVSAPLDANGHIVGLEILDARERLGDAVLAESVPIEQLTPVARANDQHLAPRETEPALPT
jgi:uncharacterized protein YuzE